MTFQNFVAMEHLAGGVGGVRDRPGLREGEFRPISEAETESEAQGEEGKCRLA